MAFTAGYKYRIYPTAAQRELLRRTFGCVRFAYNRGLTESEDFWQSSGLHLPYPELSRRIPVWRREFSWLREVSSVPVQQAVRQLASAYTQFFRKLGSRPKFKKKSGRQSATFTKVGFRLVGDQLSLALMRDPLYVRWSRALPSEPTSITVSLEQTGKWYVSFRVEIQSKLAPAPMREAVGIDMGLNYLATLSTGEKVENPRWLRRKQVRLRRAHRAFSRKQRGSKNREKARLALACAHERVAAARKDHHHKLSTQWVRENQAIHMEKLCVRGLARTRMAKSIHDAGWGSLIAFVKYKALWCGRCVTEVNRFFPSTRTCSYCGNLRSKIPLYKRKWLCEKCGSYHDRDLNAALNILAEGHSVRAGRGVRQQSVERRSDVAGTSRCAPSTKQKTVM